MAGADPGGVRWVRTNPPSSLQYQLFLRAELILGCKHTENSIAAGWDSWPTRGSIFFFFFCAITSVYSIQGRVKIRGNEWVNERDVEQFYSS